MADSAVSGEKKPGPSGESGEKRHTKSSKKQGTVPCTADTKESEALVQKLDQMLASLTALTETNKELSQRVSTLEKPTASADAPVDSNDPVDQDTHVDKAPVQNEATVDFSHENFGDDSEESADEETEDLFDFDAGILPDITGPDIDEKLGGKLNSGLLLPADKARVKSMLESYPRPGNIPSLRTPKLNRELHGINKFASLKDTRISGIQDKITCTLNIVSVLLNDFKKKKTKSFPERKCLTNLAMLPGC